MSARAARTKRNKQNYPPSPKTLGDVDTNFPEWLGKTITGEKFLLYRGPIDDGNYRSPNVWTFVSNAGLRLLIDNGVWSVDGTFKVAPKPFYQVLTIHVVTDDHRSLPVLWALMSQRKERAYIKGVFNPVLDAMHALYDDSQQAKAKRIRVGRQMEKVEQLVHDQWLANREANRESDGGTTAVQNVVYNVDDDSSDVVVLSDAGDDSDVVILPEIIELDVSKDSLAISGEEEMPAQRMRHTERKKGPIEPNIGKNGRLLHRKRLSWEVEEMRQTGSKRKKMSEHRREKNGCIVHTKRLSWLNGRIEDENKPLSDVFAPSDDDDDELKKLLQSGKSKRATKEKKGKTGNGQSKKGTQEKKVKATRQKGLNQNGEKEKGQLKKGKPGNRQSKKKGKVQQEKRRKLSESSDPDLSTDDDGRDDERYDVEKPKQTRKTAKQNGKAKKKRTVQQENRRKLSSESSDPDLSTDDDGRDDERYAVEKPKQTRKKAKQNGKAKKKGTVQQENRKLSESTESLISTDDDGRDDEQYAVETTFGPKTLIVDFEVRDL